MGDTLITRTARDVKPGDTLWLDHRGYRCWAVEPFAYQPIIRFWLEDYEAQAVDRGTLQSVTLEVMS
jgi:hypothetical protein